MRSLIPASSGRRLAVVFLAIAAATCASDPNELSYREFLARNNANIGKLAVGMTREQLMAVMGSCTSQTRSGTLGNPYRSESLQRGTDVHEVLYYLTRPHAPFVSIRDSQATPVVLTNGVVTGWGESALLGLDRRDD